MSEAPILWQPSPERIAQARISDFAGFASERSGRAFADYAALHAWSVDDRAAFWNALWDWCGVVAQTKGERIMEAGGRMPGTRWFPDARLNFAENLLLADDSVPALICYDERGRRSELDYAALRARVARMAALLRARGAEPGDRIAAYLPNGPDAIVGMLAAASVGAVWTACSPDFGSSGVIDRFGQVEARWLLFADGYLYDGREFDTLARLPEILAGLPSIEECWVVPHLRDAGETRSALAATDRAVLIDDAIATAPAPQGPLVFDALPFDHPLYVLYSSGTTGKPKCIVHGAGGALLQHLKEQQLHADLHAGDRFLYFTTCGWMMWNWLASGLASRATLVLYDGSPFHPGPSALWDIAQAERVAVLGVSAKYIDAIAKEGLAPAQTHTLPALRSLLSTGSPLAPESFSYVYEHVKRDLHLASISGGTDILGCFVGGVPTLPVRRGEIQAPCLAMQVEVFDDDGRALTGEAGELVCTRSFPTVPLGFWNDPDDARFRAAYFERFPGVWHHGDWMRRSPSGGYVIEGRSDAVLNPGGVRIGTAEIYRQVERIDEVVESLAVGQQWEGDVRVVLFVVLRSGLELDDALRSRIRETVRKNASPRHMPARVLQVPDLPRTRSGKISELAVREVVHGRPVKNAGALANPEALAHFAGRSELAG